jgi:alkanesulfonate monooxygenase SsuD/methylene tetrahydromethanopterin reductase-like flavin-dependent oxidoreductase (luciferase family)
MDGFTFSRKLGGWYLVSEGVCTLGFARRTNFGWIVTTRSGRRLETKYPRRIDAARRLACEYAAEQRQGPGSPDVAMMLNPSIGQP